jgi:hypothetical protein
MIEIQIIRQRRERRESQQDGEQIDGKRKSEMITKKGKNKTKEK